MTDSDGGSTDSEAAVPSESEHEHDEEKDSRDPERFAEALEQASEFNEDFMCAL